MANANARQALGQLSSAARQAMAQRQWPTAAQYVAQMRKLAPDYADGWFLLGRLELQAHRTLSARTSFEKCLALDSARADAAIELAALLVQLGEPVEAVSKLREHVAKLGQNPRYLFLAGQTFTRLALHAEAWPLFQQALQLQPDADSVRAAAAACATSLGEIASAKMLYTELLQKHPDHQRNHYEFAKLSRAQDTTHIQHMEASLARTKKAEHENIFMHYALGKEYEDLEEWHTAYTHYQAGGNAAARQARKAGYSVDAEIALLKTIRNICDETWLAQQAKAPGSTNANQPIFVVGLPRTGTTLVEKILAAHSKIGTVDESLYLEQAVFNAAGKHNPLGMSSAIFRAAAKKPSDAILQQYFKQISYRWGDFPYFVEGYPFNYLYLGLIARALPQAKIVLLERHPLDACFAMFKQPYFKFSYTLEDLGKYYLAYRDLVAHWKSVLPNLISVEYEALTAEPEPQIRKLIDAIGLEFETACLHFHELDSPSSTASAVQVREKIHTRSVGKWRNFAEELEPLRQQLCAAGVTV